MSGAKREATRQHLVSALPTAREQTIRAGRNAERRVAEELAKALDDEWILLRGYCNSRIGSIQAPTVRVERSARRLQALIERSRYTLDAGRRADIERLIHRDHEFHMARKPLS